MAISETPISDEARALLRRQIHGWVEFRLEERSAAEELVNRGLAVWGDWTGEDTRHVEITNRGREIQ